MFFCMSKEREILMEMADTILAKNTRVIALTSFDKTSAGCIRKERKVLKEMANTTLSSIEMKAAWTMSMMSMTI